MANLAGFDFIFELSRAAFEREFLSSPLVRGPQGEVLDTLAPPFTLKRSFPAVGSTVNAQFIVDDVQLLAVPRSADINVRFGFARSSIEEPSLGALSMLAGEFSVSATLRFTPSIHVNQGTGEVARRRSFLEVDFTQSTIALAFDTQSQQQLAQRLGPTQSKVLVDMIVSSLTDEFRDRGSQRSAFFFQIQLMGDPGLFNIWFFPDQAHPLTLSSLPTVFWIDAETLGFFGFHRKFGSGGDPARKTDSDLDPQSPFAAAVLFSPNSFQARLACPAILRMAADQVAEPLREQFIKEEMAKQGRTGQPLQSERELAERRVQEFLHSNDGFDAISARVPAPCGTGKIPKRVPLPDPFPATTAQIDHLSMTLGDGRIDVTAKAEADIPPCASVKVELPMSLTPSVSGGMISLGPLNKGTPNVEATTEFWCDAAVFALQAFLVGPVFAALGTYAAVAVTESIIETLTADELLKQDIGVPNLPTGLANIVWRAIKVERSGLTLQGDWLVRPLPDPKPFSPRVELSASVETQTSRTLVTRRGVAQELTGTPCHGGGPFGYTRHGWMSTVKLRIDAEDVPLPLTFSPWQVRIGRNAEIRPSWTAAPVFSNTVHQLTGQVLSEAGDVWYPEPPLGGQLVHRDPIEIQVRGSDTSGWDLTCEAEDGNYLIRVTTQVVDATGRVWPLSHTITVEGQTLTFGDDFYQFMEECWGRFKSFNDRYVRVAPVSPWTPVIDPERFMAEQVRYAIRTGRTGVISLLEDMIAEQGDRFADIILQDRGITHG